MRSATLPLIQLFASLAAALLDGIDPRDAYEEMEHVLVDNGGTNSDGFIGAVTPCSNYFQDRTLVEGEQSSAQWVRLVFHDFVTANLSEGTGGLDGSIAYEADRAENAGLFVNDTLGFVSSAFMKTFAKTADPLKMFPTIHAYLSMADNIALGLVAAVSTCGNKTTSTTGIPIRVGRVDALQAGPSGVPDSTTDLETTLARFAAAGFSQEDTIASTACGHSLGRIHYSNFPTIVDSSEVTVNNTDGGVAFDTTPAVFDAAVVNEYLDGTGMKGGLLITAPDVKDRSDLRLYSSDSNATMESMTDDAIFASKCYALFERMINTVPSGVELSEPVVPMTWKAVNLGLDIDSTGSVSISGLIRNLYTTESLADAVDYTITSASGNLSATTNTTAGSGTSLFGSTAYWSFNTSIPSPGVTTFNVGDISYPVNDDIFIIAPQSNANSRNSAQIKAAVLTSLVSDDEMKAVFYVGDLISGTRARVISTQNATMTEYGTAGDYTLYQVNATGNVGAGSDSIVKVVMGDLASRTLKVSILG